MENPTTSYSRTINQAAEYIATQPNMNDHSRSINIRHHAIRQDYVNGEMKIGGVGTQDNTSDILTQNLQPPLHIKYTRELNIVQNENQTLTNCATKKLTLNFGRTRDDPNTPRNRRLPQHQQLPLSPSLETDRPPIMATHTDDHPHICRQCTTTQRSQTPKESVHTCHRGAKRHHQKHQPGTLQEIFHHDEILSGSQDACREKRDQSRHTRNAPGIPRPHLPTAPPNQRPPLSSATPAL
jgi:hypothetical protein